MHQNPPPTNLVCYTVFTDVNVERIFTIIFLRFPSILLMQYTDKVTIQVRMVISWIVKSSQNTQKLCPLKLPCIHIHMHMGYPQTKLYSSICLKNVYIYRLTNGSSFPLPVMSHFSKAASAILFTACWLVSGSSRAEDDA